MDGCKGIVSVTRFMAPCVWWMHGSSHTELLQECRGYKGHLQISGAYMIGRASTVISKLFASREQTMLWETVKNVTRKFEIINRFAKMEQLFVKVTQPLKSYL